jgi:ketosteroid isomerase-like protein
LTSAVDSRAVQATIGSAREAALQFLDAYWRADLEGALATCTPDASIELPQLVALASPAPLAEVLPIIFTRVYPRFVESRFVIQINRVLADDSAVIVEYVATGPLVSGRPFHCRYLVIIEIEGGKVRRFRPYTDTKYVDAELFAERV